ncbi:hypothetical protein ACFE04_019097 [Oxalis oulophora]
MEEYNGIRFDAGTNSAKKKRSQTARRPRADAQSFGGRCEPSSLPSTPPSDDVDATYKRKELSLNQCIPKASSSTRTETERARRRIHKEDGESGALQNGDSGRKRSREGALAPANRRSNNETQHLADELVNENTVKKFKLKVGGVTCTIQTNGSANGAPGSGFSSKSSSLIDDSRPRSKQNQGTHFAKADSPMARTSGKNNSGKQEDGSGLVRKSKRVPKKRVLDDEFGEDDDDDEIRYLEKLKASRFYKEDNEEGSKKERYLSKISNSESFNTSRSARDGKRSRSNYISEDIDYGVGDNNLESDTKLEDPAEPLIESKREMTLTTRQRALQSSRDAPGSSVIEFPNGLPPAPPRKQKEKLSEVEQQVKKAEAAQKRRMQVEKAAKESQAEAIRKILNQESTRKKKEDKIKKRQEEIAQEKAASALVLKPNTVRWASSPSGDVVTFHEDIGLPSLFDSKPSGYPPPREKCAGPSCTNPYKYRDSKTNVPLCSLKCYKARRRCMFFGFERGNKKSDKFIQRLNKVQRFRTKVIQFFDEFVFRYIPV